METEYVHITLRQYDDFKKQADKLDEAYEAASKGKIMALLSGRYGYSEYVWLSDENVAERTQRVCDELEAAKKEAASLRDHIGKYNRLTWVERIFKKP